MSTATPPEKSRSTYPLLVFFLLLTATLSLVWSHVRLLWNDEFLSFYTDGVSSFKQVLLVQLHHPISLDPPTYHLLSHLCMDLLGRNAIALRLPALAGFLLFQLCVFFIVRRLAGSRSAVVAAAVPLLTASFRFSVEGRPYGLLLGLYALSLLCWQIATTDNEAHTRNRILALAGLTLSIALAITSHYFGVLILMPVTLGELARTLHRKRFDLGVGIALALGLSSVALILPFKRALMVYSAHYYTTGVTVHKIFPSYRELFLRYYTTWPNGAQQRLATAVILVTLAVAGYRRFKRRPATESASLWIALLGMALLPVFGYLFGRFVTHTLAARYVIAALVAFVATFAIVLERRLRSNTFFYAILTLITLAALAINIHSIAQERRTSEAMLASFRLNPEAADALHKDPHERIYLQNLTVLFFESYYDPDPYLRARFTLLNGPQEIRRAHSDTLYIDAVNLPSFAPLSITSYSDFRKLPHPLFVIVYPNGWVDEELNAHHVPEITLAYYRGGRLVRVTNPPRLNDEPL
jgi:uncharacterized membrane protein